MKHLEVTPRYRSDPPLERFLHRLEIERKSTYPNVKTIAGYVNISRQLLEQSRG